MRVIFNRTSHHSRMIWVSLFFLTFLALGLNIYTDYGVSWDEPIGRDNGMISLKYVGNYISSDFIAGDKIIQRYPPLHDYMDKDYGVAFELPLALLERLISISDPRNISFFRHFVTFLVSFIGVFAVYKLAERRFDDWRLGLLGALFLILSPRLFAESFYNNKDIVFMALFAIALNTAVLFIRKPTTRTAIWHALATAILIDVRIVGILLPAATAFMFLLRLYKGELRLPSSLPIFLLYLVLSVFLTILFWPYLWADPWPNFIQAFENMSHFRWDYQVLFMGKTINATELSWYYIPVWIVITTPLLYIFLFVIGSVGVLKKMVSRRWLIWCSDAEWQDLFFFGVIISPILAVIFLNSVLYDGWRQMYFIYPAFILLVLRGLQCLFKWQAAGHVRAWKTVVVLSTFFFLLSLSVWMKTSHPFQNVYFNALVGRDVKTKFDVDYWGLSSRQALQYIVDHDKRANITVRAASYIPLSFGKLVLEPYSRNRLKIVYNLKDPDYVVTQYRRLTDFSMGTVSYDLFYQVKVDEEAIITVYKRKPGVVE